MGAAGAKKNTPKSAKIGPKSGGRICGVQMCATPQPHRMPISELKRWRRNEPSCCVWSSRADDSRRVSARFRNGRFEKNDPPRAPPLGGGGPIFELRTTVGPIELIPFDLDRKRLGNEFPHKRSSRTDNSSATTFGFPENHIFEKTHKMKSRTLLQQGGHSVARLRGDPRGSKNEISATVGPIELIPFDLDRKRLTNEFPHKRSSRTDNSSATFWRFPKTHSVARLKIHSVARLLAQNRVSRCRRPWVRLG